MIGDILQPTHLLLILVVALLVLGPKRLPEVGRSLGRGLRDFRNAMSGEDHEQVSAPVSTPAPAEPEVEVPVSGAPWADTTPPLGGAATEVAPADAENQPAAEPEHAAPRVG